MAQTHEWKLINDSKVLLCLCGFLIVKLDMNSLFIIIMRLIYDYHNIYCVKNFFPLILTIFFLFKFAFEGQIASFVCINIRAYWAKKHFWLDDTMAMMFSIRAWLTCSALSLFVTVVLGGPIIRQPRYVTHFNLIWKFNYFFQFFRLNQLISFFTDQPQYVVQTQLKMQVKDNFHSKQMA